MGGPKELIMSCRESMSSAHGYSGNGLPEEEDEAPDQEKFVEHVIGLLRRVVAAFTEDEGS